MQDKKQVYEIDVNGYIKEIYTAEFDEEGKPIKDLVENIITEAPPNGLYRAKWTGGVWIEDMSQEEIDELNELNNTQVREPAFEESQIEYNVDLDYRLSIIEMGL